MWIKVSEKKCEKESNRAKGWGQFVKELQGKEREEQKLVERSRKAEDLKEDEGGDQMKKWEEEKSGMGEIER